jgi:hypothetical protein
LEEQTIRLFHDLEDRFHTFLVYTRLFLMPDGRPIDDVFFPGPPEKPQESLILGVPFSVVAESRLRVSTRRSPFYCRFQRWSDELSSFYLVFVWWSRRLGGHSDVAVM